MTWEISAWIILAGIYTTVCVLARKQHVINTRKDTYEYLQKACNLPKPVSDPTGPSMVKKRYYTK